MTREDLRIIRHEKKYWSLIAQGKIILSIDYSENDLIVFLDDTGNEKPDRHSAFFAIGGCAFIGRDYDRSLKNSWMKVRRLIFSLKDDEEFHATKHLKRIFKTPERLSMLVRWLRTPRMVTHTMSNYFQRFDSIENTTKIAVEMAMSSFDIHFGIEISESVKRDIWIYEYSEKTSWLIAANDHPQRYIRAEQHGSPKFMTKSSREPGLEMADLIAHVAGAFQRSGAAEGLGWKSRNDYKVLYEAIFSPRGHNVMLSNLFW